MSKQTLRNFTMLGLLLVITAASVQSQHHRKTFTNIPFDFIVGDKILPAGEYRLQPNRSDSHTVWLVQSKNCRLSVFFLTRPAQSGEAQETAKLVFHRYGDQYFLSQIWQIGDKSGRELQQPHRERELAQSGAARSTIVLRSGLTVND